MQNPDVSASVFILTAVDLGKQTTMNFKSLPFGCAGPILLETDIDLVNLSGNISNKNFYIYTEKIPGFCSTNFSPQNIFPPFSANLFSRKGSFLLFLAQW